MEQKKRGVERGVSAVGEKSTHNANMYANVNRQQHLPFSTPPQHSLTHFSSSFDVRVLHLTMKWHKKR